MDLFRDLFHGSLLWTLLYSTVDSYLPWITSVISSVDLYCGLFSSVDSFLLWTLLFCGLFSTVDSSLLWISYGNIIIWLTMRATNLLAQSSEQRRIALALLRELREEIYRIIVVSNILFCKLKRYGLCVTCKGRI